MESTDVIELGSSDDEADFPPIKDIKPFRNKIMHSDDETGLPAAKKIKSMQNAMVHFPNKIHGITPLKSKRKSVGKFLSSTKIPDSTNINSMAVVNKNKLNGRHLQKCMNRTNLRKSVKDEPNKLKINPMNILSNSSVVINRIPTAPKLEKHHLSVQTPRVLSNLPSSITVKKTTRSYPGVVLSRNIIRDLERTNGRKLTIPRDSKVLGQRSTAAASPQWYLRPEEQLHEESLEIQNNREPAPTTMIEITIDDSPIKPSVSKEQLKIQVGPPITIEDSPIKPSNHSTSDCDDDCKQDKTKIPVSKKKLDYPKNTESSMIEINTMEMVYDVAIEKNNTVVKVAEDSENKELQMSEGNESSGTFAKQTFTAIKPEGDGLVKDKTKESDQKHEETTKSNQDDQIMKSNENITEFHPTYQKFIDLCFELENSDDMRKIVEKKIKTYYKQVSKEYVESEEFLDLVSRKTSLMKHGPEKMYLYIKDIVDDLNIQRKMAKSHSVVNSHTTTEENVTEVLEETKYDRKRRRQIRKLEKTIKKLHKAILKLEEQEVDFDDEENSVYLLTERYKERLVRVHAKFCQITSTKMPSEPRIQISSRPGKPPGPAKRLEKWVNKKVPLGTPLPFPDFHDVLKCVKQANEEDKLGWNEADIMEEARDLFTRCGRKLQRRRQENEWRLATSRITQDADPAEENVALKKQLDENRMAAAEKEIELVNKYADQQTQLKLEGVEIGDKEADESPVESEDEEINDDSNSLDDKGKRKDRLRRLLKEKSRKTLEGNQESESLSQKKDIFEDVQRVTDEDNDITKIDSTNTSKEKVTSSNQQTNGSSAENKTVDDKVEDQMDEDNFVDKIMSDADSDNDIEEVDEKYTKVKTETKLDQDDRILLISDDSDVEELNLLQELHSGDDVSSPDSSDVDDSPIVISNYKLKSNDENHDVISIENSSYSESESTKDDVLNDEIEIKSRKSDDQNVYNLDDDSQTIQEPVLEAKLDDHENYEDAYEQSLLASSEDENIINKDVALDKYCGNYINLKDDEISISETQLQEVRNYSVTEAGDCELSQTVSNLCDEISDSDVDLHIEQDTVVLSNDDSTNEKSIDDTVAEKIGCNKSASVEVALGDKVVEKQIDDQKLPAPIIATVTLCDEMEDDNSLKASVPSQSPSPNASVLCENSPTSAKSPNLTT